MLYIPRRAVKRLEILFRVPKRTSPVSQGRAQAGIVRQPSSASEGDVPVRADRDLEAPQGVLGEGRQPAVGAISIALAGVINS
jgi:hypothetical protein